MSTKIVCRPAWELFLDKRESLGCFFSKEKAMAVKEKLPADMRKRVTVLLHKVYGEAVPKIIT